MDFDHIHPIQHAAKSSVGFAVDIQVAVDPIQLLSSHRGLGVGIDHMNFSSPDGQDVHREQEKDGGESSGQLGRFHCSRRGGFEVGWTDDTCWTRERAGE